MSIFSKMTAIANKIRSLTGATEPLTLDDMSNNLGEVNSDVSEQTDLITQIMTALEGKAAGNPDAVELNFDIKRYSSEEEMLADTPAENTIGVVTTAPITGYKFSATEPEDVNEGDVWIYVGDGSNVAFDIVNDVTVYPLSAKQYVGGAWIDKTAKSYQDNVWIEWVIYLLNGANTCDSITGGWEVRNHTSYANIGSAIFNNNGVTLSIPSSSISYAVSIMTKNKISLSNIKTISIKAENVVTDYPYNLRLYFSIEPLANVNNTGNQAAFLQFIEGENTFEIPEGLLNGEYYISIGYHSYAVGAQSATINNVFLR